VSGGARVWTHSATSVREEVCVAPPSEVYRRVGTQPAWSWGPVGSNWGCPRQAPNDGEARPIRSMPSRGGEGRVAEGSGVGGGGRSDAAKWKRGRGKWARVRVMRS
jgi:hypothetical protein